MRRIRLTDEIEKPRRYIAIRKDGKEDYLLLERAPNDPRALLNKLHTLAEFSRAPVFVVELTSGANVVTIDDVAEESRRRFI